MRVFELHFNPKAKEDRFFESFCYEPENVYEKKLGSLYIVGELKNALPQNSRFLDKLAHVIKEKYYTLSFKSPEQACKESLKRTNEFLAAEVKNENVSWLGNLSLAVISVKNLNLNFTKVGNLKILLSRDGQISDMGNRLELEEMEPYPLKIFSNIISGKLTKDDKIIVLTQEIAEFFLTKGLIKKIAKEISLEEKKLKEILKPEEKALSEISGICFLTQLREELQPTTTLTFQKEPERFSFSRALLPAFQVLRKINPAALLKHIRLKFHLPKISLPKDSSKSTTSAQAQLQSPKEEKNKIHFLFPFKKAKMAVVAFLNIPKTIKEKLTIITQTKKLILSLLSFKKQIGLIIILIVVLVVGFYIFREEQSKEIDLTQDILNEIEAQIAQAENFLILKDEKQANILLQEAWNRILSQTETGAPLEEKALSLKKSIEESLVPLNKIDSNPSVTLIFEFKLEEMNLIPQKILTLNSDLYFFNQFSPNLYKLGSQQNGKISLRANHNLKMGTTFSDSVLFFSNPNILLSLKDEQFKEKILQPPSPDFNFNKFSNFQSDVYFLDTNSGEIAKYSEPLTKEIASSRFWLDPKTKKAISVKSMVIDGSIWILTKSNEIDRYYGGFYKETLKLHLFPSFENPTKIWTSPNHSYLYILEPVKKRLVILTKKGEIVKQYQSEQFNNLLDFAVSEDSKTIWLLNGLKVFQLEF